MIDSARSEGLDVSWLARKLITSYLPISEAGIPWTMPNVLASRAIPIRPRVRLGRLVDSVVPQQDSGVLAVTLASTAKAPLTGEYTPPVGEGTRCHAGRRSTAAQGGVDASPGLVPHGQKLLEWPITRGIV